MAQTLVLLCCQYTATLSREEETEQAVQGLQAFAFCVINVTSTVVFKHFEDLKDLTILNILKEKLVMSCLLDSIYLKIV